MEEQFQGGVCGGSWWINPSTNLFRSSPCSSSITGAGSFGWPGNDLPPAAQAARSLSDDSTGSASEGPGSVAIASSLQMMGINFSSSATTDPEWNQDLLHKNGKSEENYSHNLPAACLIGPAGMNSYGPGFQLNPASFNYSLPLLQTLLDVNSDQPGPQTLLSNNRSTNYGPSQDYVSPSGFHPTLRSKVQETQQHENIHLQFTNNGPFWNGLGSGFVPSSPTQLVHPSSINSSKPNFHNLNTKKHNQETGRGSNSAAAPKKGGHEAAAATKRPRVEAPLPLPAFKVRKEKLGDRITALQQLVSPFGKTDTASVLHEAIEYIKFLHEQVNVLSTPYLKQGSPPLQHQQMQGQDADGVVEDLQSRGLCLVPISTTFPVAAETATDFWAPTFGGCFR